MVSVNQAITLLAIVCQVSDLPAVTATLAAVYLPTSCAVPTALDTSLQLESSTALTYFNNMNCKITFTTPSPFRLLANFKRFELEPKYSGTCHDYVNLYDGRDLSSSTLNTQPLCGSSLTSTLYVTTGQQLTVDFITDSTAVYHGFNIILTAVTTAPCGSTQFQCNNSYCIDSTLVCDDYDQCGDASDEDNCAATLTSGSTNWMPLIVGLTLGLLAVLLLVAFIVYRYHQRNKWRRFTDERIRRDDDLPDPDPSYPVTSKYFRGIRGHPNMDTYESVDDNKISEKKKMALEIES